MSAQNPKTESVDPVKVMIDSAINAVAERYENSDVVTEALEMLWNEHLKTSFVSLRAKQEALVSLVALVGSQDNRIMRLLNFILTDK